MSAREKLEKVVFAKMLRHAGNVLETQSIARALTREELAAIGPGLGQDMLNDYKKMCEAMDYLKESTKVMLTNADKTV